MDTPVLGARPSALSGRIPYTAVATEPLKYGRRDWGTEFLIDFLLVTLHVNRSSQMWLPASYRTQQHLAEDSDCRGKPGTGRSESVSGAAPMADAGENSEALGLGRDRTLHI